MAVAKRQYDVVFVYGLSPILLAIPAIFLSWVKRRKLIVWVQDLWPDSLAATGYIRNSHVLRVVEWVVRWIYRHTDLLLVQSPAFQAPRGSLGPGEADCLLPQFDRHHVLRVARSRCGFAAGHSNG